MSEVPLYHPSLCNAPYPSLVRRGREGEGGRERVKERERPSERERGSEREEARERERERERTVRLIRIKITLPRCIYFVFGIWG